MNADMYIYVVYEKLDLSKVLVMCHMDGPMGSWRNLTSMLCTFCV